TDRLPAAHIHKLVSTCACCSAKLSARCSYPAASASISPRGSGRAAALPAWPAPAAGVGSRAGLFSSWSMVLSHEGVKMASSAKKSLAIDIGISENNRAKISDNLSRLLADTYTLYLMTHSFHWNVTGPMFNTLHTMFMGQYTELWNSLDTIAERIRALGH